MNHSKCTLCGKDIKLILSVYQGQDYHMTCAMQTAKPTEYIQTYRLVDGKRVPTMPEQQHNDHKCARCGMLVTRNKLHWYEDEQYHKECAPDALYIGLQEKKAEVEEIVMESNPIDCILDERGKRYGDFNGHAKITQEIKNAMGNHTKWHKLSNSQKEALEMIAHKIGRILNGDPNYKDSWTDIIGYARLVEQDLEN